MPACRPHARVAGSVICAFNTGAFAEEIRQDYSSLDLADIYLVIGYYLRHREAVDAYLEECEKYAEEVRRAIEAEEPYEKIRERLLARRAAKKCIARLRFLTDEDFRGRITRGLLRRLPRLDLVRVQDVGLLGQDDPVVLEWAAREVRVVLGHDFRTMKEFAYARVRQGLPMPGLFLVSQSVPIRRAIEELVLLAVCSLEGEWGERFDSSSDATSGIGRSSTPIWRRAGSLGRICSARSRRDGPRRGSKSASSPAARPASR